MGTCLPPSESRAPFRPSSTQQNHRSYSLYCVFVPSSGSELRAAVGALLRISSNGRADNIASVGARAGLHVKDTAVGALVDDLLREADADVL